MLNTLMSCRFVMIFASTGATAGALILFWEAFLKLIFAFQQGVAGGNEKLITAAVMGCIDKLLFGIVLIIIAYAILFGFVIELSEERRAQLPGWMKIESVADLKRIFFEVILLYLTVDFATDIAASEVHLSWETLVMPTSILLLAGAMRLGMSERHDDTHPALVAAARPALTER